MVVATKEVPYAMTVERYGDKDGGKTLIAKDSSMAPVMAGMLEFLFSIGLTETNISDLCEMGAWAGLGARARGPSRAGQNGVKEGFDNFFVKCVNT